MKKLLIAALFITFVFGSTVVNADTSTTQEIKAGWKAIGAGGSHSLAVKQDGTVWAWGQNTFGQLGNGEYGDKAKDQFMPIQVKGIENVVAVAGGSRHSLAVKKDGTVWAWGGNVYGEIGDGTNSTMDDTTYKILINNDRPLPVQVKNLDHIIAVTAGWYVSYALKDDGTVWVWGIVSMDIDGKQVYNSTVPLQITSLTDIVSVAVGWNQFMALKKDGTVWTWGSNSNGQLGDGLVTISEIKDHVMNVIEYHDTRTPAQIKDFNNVKAIAAGASFAVAVKNDGTVWAWGSNGKGQLGDGTKVDKHVPTLLKTISNVETVAADTGGPIFLKKDGTVWTTGDNSGGQLGNGSYKDQDVPAQVQGLSKVNQIASGIGFHVMAIAENNSLWTWGMNSNGQIGDGEKWYRTIPVWVKSYDSEVVQTEEKPKPAEITVDIIHVKLDGKLLDFDQPPVLIKGKTMVPLRKIFESLGAEIQWDAATSTVTATKGQTVVKLTVGNDTAYVNGQGIKLEAAPTIVNEKTVVPARFIGESFGAKVTWEEATKTVLLQTK
ncbi:MAG: hypothetical protein JWM44_1669 [Bacilli bacterium]|nr:hypothetical protein [Bacilli bacterium]